MIRNTLKNGVWPTAVTPFDNDGNIDISALNALVDFYTEAEAAGIFGVCQSSEMFYMSRDERDHLARATIKAAKGKLPVILSGHVSDDPEQQLDELMAMTALKPQAVVLVTNRLATEFEDDEVWFDNLKALISCLPDDILLGLYECPYPYKRLLSPELLSRCAATGRFGFLKDTSCDSTQIRARLNALKGSALKLFNANAATLLDSLRAGAAGYSGVMANFHPEHYVRLCRDWEKSPEEAEMLMDFLGPASIVECRCYPVSAKYYLSLAGIPFTLNSHSLDPDGLMPYHKLELEQLYRLSERFR